jgi:hypothetical protein
VPELSVEPLSPASVVRSETGQTVSEDRPVEVDLLAEEPSDAQVNGDRDTLPWQVSKRPRIVGMDPGGSLCARRATSYA